MARVVVEQVFDPPMSDEDYARFAKKLDLCLEVRTATWRRSYVSTDKRRVFCEFEAPDAESVREALRMSGVPYERVWAADVFAVEDYPELVAKLEKLLARSAS